MNFLSQMRIGTRLAVGFAIVLLLAVFATSVALVNARANAAATKHMMEKPLAKERLVSDWYVLIYSAIARTALIARSSDETLSTTFADVIAASSKRGSELLGEIKELLVTDEEKAAFEASVAFRNTYQKAKTDIMNAKKAGNAAEAEKLFKDAFTPAADAYQNKVKELLTYQRKAIDDTAHAIEAANDRSNMLQLVLTVLMVSMGTLAAWIISRSITVPLHSAIGIASTVAAGDLTTHFSDERSQCEMGDLMTALKGMNDSLHRVVSQVQVGTSTIATASNEIAAGNLDLSQRTEEQASSLEETASSMEQLTSTVRQNAEKRQAGQPAGAGGVGRGGKRRRHRRPGGRHHGLDQRFVAQDRRHHRRHRRHCVPDQYPGAERRGGSGARRRTGPRLRRRRLRGAQPGAALGRRGQGNQGIDRQLGRPDRHRRQAGAAGRRHHGGRGGQRAPRHRHHGRDHLGQQRAKHRHRPGQHRHHADGPGDAAERGAGRGSGGGRRQHAGPGGAAGRSGVVVQAGQRGPAGHAGRAGRAHQGRRLAAGTPGGAHPGTAPKRLAAKKPATVGGDKDWEEF